MTKSLLELPNLMSSRQYFPAGTIVDLLTIAEVTVHWFRLP